MVIVWELNVELNGETTGHVLNTVEYHCVNDTGSGVIQNGETNKRLRRAQFPSGTGMGYGNLGWGNMFHVSRSYVCSYCINVGFK